MMNPLPTMAQTFSILVQEEKTKGNQSTFSSSSGFHITECIYTVAQVLGNLMQATTLTLSEQVLFQVEEGVKVCTGKIILPTIHLLITIQVHLVIQEIHSEHIHQTTIIQICFVTIVRNQDTLKKNVIGYMVFLKISSLLKGEIQNLQQMFMVIQEVQPLRSMKNKGTI